MKKHRQLIGVLPPYRNNVGKFKIINDALVDNHRWFTVQVNPDIRTWLSTQPKELCYSHITPNSYRVANTFDIHEKIYSLMVLRWS